uniref:pirin family protein n=1 Tax=Flavobacterium sp. TaxID=239 RepID=UPI0040497A06
MKNYTIHKAATRGKADHGWLQANFSFSFANYYNPERMNFGVLRVLNDDIIGAGMGFGTHPHENMEIITIPLSGALAHKDSMGNAEVIQTGDIQVMSAGTGIQHSEFNPNEDKPANTLQIWMFPKYQNVTPRYDQLSLNKEDRKNKLQQILSPNPDDEGVWIHQDAWFFLGDFDANQTINYQPKLKTNGLYIFVLEGNVTIDNEKIAQRDAFGIWDYESVSLQFDSQTQVLLMDVPMR